MPNDQSREKAYARELEKKADRIDERLPQRNALIAAARLIKENIVPLDHPRFYAEVTDQAIRSTTATHRSQFPDGNDQECRPRPQPWTS